MKIVREPALHDGVHTTMHTIYSAKSCSMWRNRRQQITHKGQRYNALWKAQPKGVGNDIDEPIEPIRNAGIPNSINRQNALVKAQELAHVKDAGCQVGDQKNKKGIVGQNSGGNGCGSDDLLCEKREIG